MAAGSSRDPDANHRIEFNVLRPHCESLEFGPRSTLISVKCASLRRRKATSPVFSGNRLLLSYFTVA